MREIIAVLHNIRSVHNVGSIFRTADAANISKVWLCGITPKPTDVFGNVRKDFMKVSLGAERSVAWEHGAQTARILKCLKKEGWWLCGVEQSKKAVSYRKLAVKHRRRIALVFGNEVRGIPPSLLKRCDAIISIPMLGNKESLNVSVAFGIVAYAMRLGV